MSCDLRLSCSSRADKRLELQIRPVGLIVEMKESRQVDRAIGAINLPILHLEVAAQPLDHLGVGVGLDFQANGVALAPVVQFGAHRLEQIARLFFLQIEIAVAGDAERGFGDDLVAAIHVHSMGCHQIGQENVILAAIARRQLDSRGKTRGTVTTPM